MAACQGALLLVDATVPSEGIQAQSISVYHVARDRGVHIIPQIDLPASSPERIAAQMQHTFNISPSDILQVSAKTGQGVPELLQAIVDRVPSPAVGQDPSAVSRTTMRALLFDSQYDRYRGVVSLVSLQSGQLRKGRDKIASCHTRKRYDVVDIGIMHPEEESTGILQAGQVGYITCNMKDSNEAHIGDTLHHAGEQVDPLPGFRPAKAMVFAGVYPVDSNEFPKLEESVKRLLLTDRSVTANRESSASLGQGIRLGALGSLHMDVLRQRLEDEYGAQIIVTAPTLSKLTICAFRLVLRNGNEKEVSNPVDFPDPGEVGTSSGSTVREILEPIVHATIIVPRTTSEICSISVRPTAHDLTHAYLSDADSRIVIRATLPLSEIVTDFHDRVKHRSSGFASFDYEAAVDEAVGAEEVVPKQLFEIAIQATIGSKVIARETLSAQRKDVTAGLYGGHYERKMKVLNKQKEGKKKMKKIGNVELPQEAFYDVLSSKIE
ncbi:Translation factor GUF1 -like protein, mitochondrial [Rhizoctonia solani]|uniref:Translation factor GUF1 -like protein, mitochondrial n=1 Tax=Rhizoctonia solani TaxID=456999 RepID=A0A8H7M988_9AGAM|nr:Translation factor GUF1 -like protein, mitochondrial [Rhizoctonia solani]